MEVSTLMGVSWIALAMGRTSLEQTVVAKQLRSVRGSLGVCGGSWFESPTVEVVSSIVLRKTTPWRTKFANRSCVRTYTKTTEWCESVR